ncbi:MAG: nucleotidyltransferase family protein [Verrucomicrobiota bacterium]
MSYTLVVLAAGMGSRYGGLKQVTPVGSHGEWLLDYSVYDAWRNGANKVVFVIRPDLESAMRERFDRLTDRLAVEYVHQRTGDIPAPFTVPATRSKPWGTGHAVRAARNALDQPFVVINADDFYGPDAYAQVAGFFAESATSADSAEFAMVAFPLRNTLSDYGTVSRGVCMLDDEGCLAEIKEVEAIYKTPDGDGLIEQEGDETRIPGDTPVSMNFWAFTPKLWPLLEDGFVRFLNEASDDPRREFYLPAAIDQAIAEDRCRVKVLKTTGQWLGMTYPSDHPAVAAGLADLVKEDVYPEPLW